MDVTTAAALRETYALKSSTALQRIAESPEGEYTPEAVVVAKEILSSRPASPGDAEQEEAPSPRSRSLWRQIGSIMVVIYGAKQLFYTWRAAARNPHAFQEGARRAVGDPWTYAVAAALLVLVWRSGKGRAA